MRETLDKIFSEAAGDPEAAALRVARRLLRERSPDRPVLIKPNIVKNAPPPVTTDVRVVAGIIAALQERGIREIVVAEGSGTGDTLENFAALGYGSLGVSLMDLDREEAVEVPVRRPHVWKSVWVARPVAGDYFLMSVPVLKEHSMLDVTVSLKNIVGCLTASRYAGYWTYKKSEIHRNNPHGCVADLCRAVRIDAAVVDGTVGMKGSHISGTPCSPPLNTVFGSLDPLAADIHGARLLGIDWNRVAYLRLIHDTENGSTRGEAEGSSPAGREHPRGQS